MTITEEWKEAEQPEPRAAEFELARITPAPNAEGSAIGLADGAVEAFTRVDLGGLEGRDRPAIDDSSSTTDGTWETQAACRSVVDSTQLFFSEELADIVAAKRICAECPVIAPCLEGAIARAEPCGVWGGQLFSNGRILAQKRRRGRPPKVARPEDQLPVVPVPEHLQRLIA